MHKKEPFFVHDAQCMKKNNVTIIIVIVPEEQSMSIRFDEQFIRRVIPECTIVAHEYPNDARFSVDTRTLQPGDIFIALQGAQIDGAVFVNEALKKGASGLIIAQSK